jgi:hypothetical protein
MSYNLFLDDIRTPSQVKWIALPLVEWIVVRNFDQFKGYIMLHGIPTRVSFDHDLAPEHYNPSIDWTKPLTCSSEPTGYDCVKWLIDYCQEHSVEFPEYYLHTLNDAGKKNMESYIRSFAKSKQIKAEEQKRIATDVRNYLEEQ